MDQSTARSLAREIGRRAERLGITITRTEDPLMSELAAECAAQGVDIRGALTAS